MSSSQKAKREAEGLVRQAQAQAKQLVSQEATYKEAQAHAEEMIRTAQAKIKELKQVTNDYVDDSLKRTEEAIAEALGEIRESAAASASWSALRSGLLLRLSKMYNRIVQRLPAL